MCPPPPVSPFSLAELSGVRRFSGHSLNYTTLLLEDERGILYVGARGAIFALNASNVADGSHRTVSAAPWPRPLVPEQPPNGERGFWEPPPCHRGGCEVVSAFLPADPLGSVPGEAAGLPAEGQKQQGGASTGRRGGTRWRCHRLVTGVLFLLLSTDRVLQPRAVPAEAQQHAPLHLRHLRLPPALRCHRESSRPRSRPLLGRSDPVSGHVALGWQRRGVVDVTQTPPVPTPALGLDSDPAAGWCWGHVGTQGGTQKGGMCWCWGSQSRAARPWGCPSRSPGGTEGPRCTSPRPQLPVALRGCSHGPAARLVCPQPLTEPPRRLAPSLFEAL